MQLEESLAKLPWSVQAKNQGVEPSIPTTVKSVLCKKKVPAQLDLSPQFGKEFQEEWFDVERSQLLAQIRRQNTYL